MGKVFLDGISLKTKQKRLTYLILCYHKDLLKCLITYIWTMCAGNIIRVGLQSEGKQKTKKSSCKDAIISC